MADEKTDFSLPPVPPLEAAPPPSAPVVNIERDPVATSKVVEIELVDEMRTPPTVNRAFTMAEIHTQNRVYHVDVNMRCIEVIDIASDHPIGDHGLLGARLLGGQHNDETTTYLSHPLPRPGSEAVFEQRRKADVMFSHSSTVTRVVLRLRQVSIVTGGEQTGWHEIAGAARDTAVSGE